MSETSAANVSLTNFDEDTKNLVHGFIRNIQKSVLLIIPDPIIWIVLSFYFAPECFKDFDKSVFKCIDKHCQIIKCVSANSSWSSIYGNIMVSSNRKQKCLWKLRLNKFNVGLIGISSTYDVDKRFFVSVDSYNYCFYSADGSKVSKDDYQDYSTAYDEGDVITMILDCKLKQLSFHKNDEDLGVAYDNIGCGSDIKYRMAVYIYELHEEVELLEFSLM